MTVYDISGALVGLAGACSNNGNAPEADRAVREALTFQAGHPEADPAEIKGWIEKIHAVKFSISPNCAVCAAPCGNTSDLPMEAIAAPSDPVGQYKKELLDTLCRLALAEGDALPIETAYEALLYIQSVDEADLLREELAGLTKRLAGE